MDKIAAEGKIRDWTVKGKKDRLVFGNLDFAPGQLANMARMIQTKEKGECRMTVEPKDKRLGIAAIESTITLEGCDIRKRGVQPAVSGFSVPDSRVQAMVRFIREETPMIVTIWIQQPNLPGMDDVGTSTNTGEPEPDDEVVEPVGLTLEMYKIPFSGLKKVSAGIRLAHRGDDWQVGYSLRIGNHSVEKVASDSDIYAGRTFALDNLQSMIEQWLDGIEPTGRADQRRSMAARIKTMREQIVAWIRAQIAEAA